MAGRTRRHGGSVRRADRRGDGGDIAGRQLLEVCASNASLVGQVDDDGLVAEEGDVAGQGRKEIVGVSGMQLAMLPVKAAGSNSRSAQRRSVDLAVLAREISNLAIGLSAGVTRRRLAALVGVEMGASSRAVAILGHSFLVDVVQEWTELGRQAGERDLNGNALARGTAGDLDGTSNSELTLGREDGLVLSADGVGLNNRSVLGNDGRGHGEQGEERLGTHGSECGRVMEKGRGLWSWQLRKASECN